MKQRLSILTSFLCAIALVVVAQVDCKIYQLPTFVASASDQQKVRTSDIRTSGVVTAVVRDGDTIKGFYLQDKVGDGDRSTCDAVFVALNNEHVAVGNEIELVASVTSMAGQLTLTDVSVLHKVAENQAVTPTKVIFPKDFSNYNQYVGMVLEFDQTLFVTNNYYWGSGRITLSSHRLNGGVEVELPGSNEYFALVAKNKQDQLTLVSSPSAAYPFADEHETLRMGYRVDNLQGTLVQSGAYYQLEVSTRPNFYGNPRTATHEPIGDYNVKVCSFNMQYYLRSAYGDFAGPANEEEADRQHAKLLKALLAIDADIYGLLEIQQGNEAIAYMCTALNIAVGRDVYAYVADGTSTSGSYTKVGFIYRKDKISPVGALEFNNLKTMYRKAIQLFSLKSTGEKFFFSLNHFKAKGTTYSTTPEGDLDAGDGQSTYNATRVAEANSVISKCANNLTVDPDILVMGDMNAYSKEDPIRRFESAGYTNVLKHYHGDTIYSYSYRGEVGLLDHALANNTMMAQITGATVFHINTDEHYKFEYKNAATCQDNMYRSSDHDVVVVGLNLKGTPDSVVNVVEPTKTCVIPTVVKDDFITIYNAAKMDVTISDLQGRLCYSGKLPNDTKATFTTDQLNLSQGFYVIRIVDPRSTAIEPQLFKVIVR
ncbi:MAG TPA: ExeM/NucH family extracellular endonuclease [Paludibacteraceae bacterium]|nr:ExeM/NucH family extracellular endonuclease [Paludibacteraceae bacterium]